MKKQIEVVAAVMVKDKKYFCAQRKDSGELAKKWEFPGGKIEAGETREQALARELKEELKIDVKVNDFIMTVNHEYNTFIITMHAFFVQILSGEIVLTEHLDSKWVSLDEMESIDFAAADIPIIKYIKK